MKILNLDVLEGGGKESVDAEALLAPAAMLGGGVPDVLPRITAALAVDLLTLRETHTQQRREEGRRAYPSMAVSLALMRREGGKVACACTRASKRRAGSAASS